MWPVQTLTLFLCLNDEEQLFAQQLPTIADAVRAEVAAPFETPASEESDCQP